MIAPDATPEAPPIPIATSGVAHHWVYAMYIGEEIVYIGRSSNPASRWTTHLYNSPFIPWVDALGISAPFTREEAGRREIALIRYHRPTFCITSNPDYEALGNADRRLEYERRMTRLREREPDGCFVDVMTQASNDLLVGRYVVQLDYAAA